MRIVHGGNQLRELVPVGGIHHQCSGLREFVALGRDEHEHQAGRIYRQECGRAMLALDDVYCSEFVIELAVTATVLRQF
jgi:hypothetical protein